MQVLQKLVKIFSSLFFIIGFFVFSNNVLADTYKECIADSEALIEAAIAGGLEKAEKLKQKQSLKACWKELETIESKYEMKTPTNPSKLMSKEDRLRWAKLFEAIDTKRFTGTRFLIAAYYRK